MGRITLILAALRGDWRHVANRHTGPVPAKRHKIVLSNTARTSGLHRQHRGRRCEPAEESAWPQDVPALGRHREAPLQEARAGDGGASRRLPLRRIPLPALRLLAPVYHQPPLTVDGIVLCARHYVRMQRAS